MSNFEEYLTQMITSAVNDAVQEATKDLRDVIRIATKPPYLTKQRAMEMTGWSSRTLQYLRDSNQIDYIKHGRKILYPTDALYEFFENHRIKASK